MLHTDYTLSGGTLDITVSGALPCPFKEARALSLAAALCARDAIGGDAKIHWPGDIMLTNIPICHVAVRGGGDRVEARFSLDMAALDAAGITLSAEALASDITAGLESAVSNCPEVLGAITQRYCEHCITLMKFVDVTYRGMPVYGCAFAVDRHGGLMVMTQESHTVITVYSGPAVIASDSPDAPEMPVMPRV